MFCEIKSIVFRIKKFRNVYWRTLMLEFLFTKITGLKGLCEKETPTQMFSREYCKIFKSTQRILLYKKLNELIHDEPMFVPVRILQSEPTTEGFLQKIRSSKFCNIHSKIPVLESRFNKVASLQTYKSIRNKLQHKCFPVDIGKFIRKVIHFDTT